MSEADSNIQVDVPVVKKKFTLSRLGANAVALARAHRLALGIIVGVIGLFLVASVGADVVSSQPNFCINCHEISPAYEQWRTSSHYGITCINCHTEPGLSGFIKVNTEGVQNLITHFTVAYHVPTEADVNAASCLSCHPRDTLPESSVRTTLRMAHSKHTQQECADCHGRLVHVSTATEVSTSPKPHIVRDCTVCHTPDNCPHGDATLACTSCHSGNIPKHDAALVRGVMPRQSCQECHKKNKVGSPEYCQTCHVSPHGVSVPCSRCHTSNVTWTEHSFNHPVPLIGKHTGLDCGKCHGTKTLTGLQYVCSNCHQPPTVHKGTNGDCAICHSPEDWKPTKVSTSSGSGHRFPQNHNGANGNCAMCHPQGNTATINCYTCHTQATLDAKHATKGMTNIATLCGKCHPEGKKP